MAWQRPWKGCECESGHTDMVEIPHNPRRIQTTRDNELKMRSDWEFAFCNYMKGIDPAVGSATDVVEKNINEDNEDYALDDLADEMNGMSGRLSSLLTSYLRQRPLKLVRHIKQENVFAAW